MPGLQSRRSFTARKTSTRFSFFNLSTRLATAQYTPHLLEPSLQKNKKNKHKNKLFGLLGQQIKTDLYTVVSRKIILQSQKSVWTCDVTCTKSIFWKILLCSTNVWTFDLVQTNEVSSYVYEDFQNKEPFLKCFGHFPQPNKMWRYMYLIDKISEADKGTVLTPTS